MCYIFKLSDSYNISVKDLQEFISRIGKEFNFDNIKDFTYYQKKNTIKFEYNKIIKRDPLNNWNVSDVTNMAFMFNNYN